MKEISKKEVQKIIEEYFSGNEIDSEKTKKIKTLAMANRVRLGEYRKRFCKKCYSDLKLGKTRISKTHKQIICNNCKFINKFKIS